MPPTLSRKLLLWLGLPVATLVLLAGLCASAPSPSQQAFEWFDGLGFPDVRDRKFVRVATGEWSASGNDQPKNHHIEAFLLGQSNETFTVFTRDLFVRTLKISEPAKVEHERISFAEISLAKEGEAYLKLLENPPEDNWRRFGQRLREPAEVFAFAWACDRNGQRALAQRLFEQSVFMYRKGNATGNFLERLRAWVTALVQRGPKRFSIREQLEADLGESMMWRAVVAFGDPSVSRPELLEQFQDVVRNYPNYKDVAQAKETAGILREMIAEDQNHAAAGTNGFEKLPDDTRIAELIFRLRDQNGQQWSQPGACDIFLDPRGTNSPADQLVQFGYAAVPALIEALDDKRFTRSVGYWRNFVFSHNVLTVGDTALAILQRTTGRRFYTRATTSGYMSKDGKTSSSKELAQSWWREFREKGERQMLIDGTERGDDDSPAQAELLRQRFPDALANALMRGASNASTAWIRDSLVQNAGSITNESATKFLSNEMTQSPYLRARVSAALALHKRGDLEAVRMMIEEWGHLPADSPENDDEQDVECLISFLANCNSPAAIEALGHDLRKRAVDVRLSVVSAFGEEENYSTVTDGGLSLNLSEKGEDQSAEVMKAIEGLLVTTLEDTDERVGMSGSWDGKSFDDPRICDLAAHVLSEQWPAKYRFDLGGGRKDRERERVECMNVWRKENNLQLVGMTQQTRTPAISPEIIRPVLAELREAKSQSKIKDLLGKIESLGVPALEEICRAPGIPESHPAHTLLQSLQKRLSCIVSQMDFSEDSIPADESLVKLLAALTNSPLTSEKFLDVLLHGPNSPAMLEAEIRANREDDFSGVSLRIKLTNKRKKESAPQNGWDTRERVRLGEKSLLGSSGGSSLNYGATREAYNDLAKAINQALDSPPEVPFEINVSLIRKE